MDPTCPCREKKEARETSGEREKEAVEQNDCSRGFEKKVNEGRREEQEKRRRKEWSAIRENGKSKME